MRTIRIRVLATGMLVFAAVAAAGAAQEAAPGLLTASQVRGLAAKASTPAEHSQLRDHFTVLAGRYEADAKRFAGKAPLAGNPNRRSGVDYQMHWTRLGQTAAEMAKSARELAAFHGQLAGGTSATRPADSAHVEHLEGGAGAPTMMSDAQLRQLVASARTPSEHGTLAEYFNSLVTKYSQDADSHAAMAAAYRSNPRGAVSAADHCDRLVKQGRAAATDARALAGEHQATAK
jgi:hypothetical protein